MDIFMTQQIADLVYVLLDANSVQMELLVSLVLQDFSFLLLILVELHALVDISLIQATITVIYVLALAQPVQTLLLIVQPAFPLLIWYTMKVDALSPVNLIII
jgi:hypothetical protein